MSPLTDDYEHSEGREKLQDSDKKEVVVILVAFLFFFLNLQVMSIYKLPQYPENNKTAGHYLLLLRDKCGIVKF